MNTINSIDSSNSINSIDSINLINSINLFNLINYVITDSIFPPLYAIHSSKPDCISENVCERRMLSGDCVCWQLDITFICLFAFLPICLFAYLPNCLFAYLPICLFFRVFLSYMKSMSNSHPRVYGLAWIQGGMVAACTESQKGK